MAGPYAEATELSGKVRAGVEIPAALPAVEPDPDPVDRRVFVRGDVVLPAMTSVRVVLTTAASEGTLLMVEPQIRDDGTPLTVFPRVLAEVRSGAR